MNSSEVQQRAARVKLLLMDCDGVLTGSETRERAHYVTKAQGGYGAIREVIELILKAQDRWNDLVKRYVDTSPAVD